MLLAVSNSIMSFDSPRLDFSPVLTGDGMYELLMVHSVSTCEEQRSFEQRGVFFLKFATNR